MDRPTWRAHSLRGHQHLQEVQKGPFLPKSPSFNAHTPVHTKCPKHTNWVGFCSASRLHGDHRALSGRKAHHSFQSAWHNVRMMSNWQPTPLLIFVSWREYTTSWLTHLVKVFHYLIMHHYLTLGSMEGKWRTWHLIEVPRNAHAYLLQPENVESSTWTTLPSMNGSQLKRFARNMA